MKLLRIFSIFFIVTFLNEVLIAQNKVDIGIEAGPSLIFLRGNKIVYNYSKGIGFAGGPSFQYNFGNHLALKTNLFIERKGAIAKGFTTADDYPFLIGGNGVTLHEHYDYLTLPILVHASLGKTVRFFLNTGPYFGFLLKQHNKLEGPDIMEVKWNNTDKWKRLDMGLVLGLGCYIPLTEKLAFTFELRHNYGLYEINDFTFADGGSMKTNATNLLIGVAYRLGNSN